MLVSAGAIIGDGVNVQVNSGAIVRKLHSASFLTPEMMRCLDLVKGRFKAPKKVTNRAAVATKEEIGKDINGATQVTLGGGPSQQSRFGLCYNYYHSTSMVRRGVRYARGRPPRTAAQG